MVTKRDYYDILGVSKSATEEELKRAYRKKALQWHPDRNKSPEAEKNFKEINEAYEVLSNSQKRSAYDQFGYAAFTPGGAPGTGGGFDGFTRTGRYGPFTYTYTTDGGPFSARGGSSPGWEEFDFTDPFEIFEQFFGTASPFGRRQRKQHYHLDISFMEAAKGVEKEIVIEGKRRKIKIPPGADNGTHLAFSDFDITVGVSPHPIFQRDGADLIIEVQVPLTVAILGGEVKAPTIDGDVKLRIRPGTPSGTMVRLRERGVLRLRSRGRGDQYVKIFVTMPEKITRHQQGLIEQLQEEGL